MEYHDSEKATEVADRVEAFMDEVVIPREREALRTGDHISDDELHDLWEQAKARDLFAPQVPEEYGGQGLDFSDMLPAFEQAGRSLIGAEAIRANAPQEGNMHTLEMVGTEAQKEEWLRPLVQGEVQSAFSMTEPMQGAGSDPKMLQTTAYKDGDEWVINGHKWWSSDGYDADFLLVMARTDMDEHPYAGSSIILVPTDTDGVEIVRNAGHLGGHGILENPGGHAEIKYRDVRVPVENTVGEENAGFRIAQMRLGGARLTHCMRFSGMPSARSTSRRPTSPSARRSAPGSTRSRHSASASPRPRPASTWPGPASATPPVNSTGPTPASRSPCRRCSPPASSTTSSTSRSSAVAATASRRTCRWRTSTRGCGRSASSTAPTRSTSAPSPGTRSRT